MPKQIKETPLNSSVVFQKGHTQEMQSRKKRKEKKSFPPRSIHHIA